MSKPSHSTSPLGGGPPSDDDARAVAEFFARRPWLLEQPPSTSVPTPGSIEEIYAQRPWLAEPPPKPTGPEPGSWEVVVALKPWLAWGEDGPVGPEPGSWEEVVVLKLRLSTVDEEEGDGDHSDAAPEQEFPDATCPSVQVASEGLCELRELRPWLFSECDCPASEPASFGAEDGAVDINVLRPWLRAEAACACGGPVGAERCAGNDDCEKRVPTDGLAWLLNVRPWLVGGPVAAGNPEQPTLHAGIGGPGSLHEPSVSLLPRDLSLSGPILDIFLSAGPSVDYLTSSEDVADWDSQAYRACNRDDPRNCGIWRVTLRLGASKPLFVDQIAYASRETDPHEEWAGASMPALSPNGRYVAYRRQNYSDIHRPPATRGFSKIVVHDLHTGSEVSGPFSIDPMIDPERATLFLRGFPAWYDDRTLLYTRSEEPGVTLYASDFHAASFTLINARAVMGPGTSHFPNTVFSNPDVRRDVPRDDRFPALSPHPRVVSFGTGGGDRSCVAIDGETPRVHGLHGESGSGSQNFECFNLGRAATGRQGLVRSCQHPTWSIDGRTIYCWQKDPGDVWGSQRSTLKMTYAYRWSREKTVWRPKGGGPTVSDVDKHMPFVPPLPEDLEAMFGALFPAKGYGSRPQCLDTAYKHASECGNSNFMLMTLFCTDNEYNYYNDHSDVFSSRVVLVRESPLKLWDITAMIETEMAYEPDSLQGIYSTSKKIAD